MQVLDHTQDFRRITTPNLEVNSTSIDFSYKSIMSSCLKTILRFVMAVNNGLARTVYMGK